MEVFPKKWTVHFTSCATPMMRCTVHFFRDRYNSIQQKLLHCSHSLRIQSFRLQIFCLLNTSFNNVSDIFVMAHTCRCAVIVLKVRCTAKHRHHGEINRIYHHIAGGTTEFHLSVQDFQSTIRLAELWMLSILDTGCAKSWMLLILDTRMGFPSPSRNVAFDYFSPICEMYKSNNKKAIIK